MNATITRGSTNQSQNIVQLTEEKKLKRGVSSQILRIVYKDRRSLVYSLFKTSGQETERVYSYNPGAHTGLEHQINI